MSVTHDEISTPDHINANSVFRSRIVQNKMYYEALNVQPNTFTSSPAIFDFGTGTNTSFDVGQFQLDFWVETGIQITEYEATEFKEDEGILVLAITYLDANSVEKYGVAFVTYDFEVISFRQIPHKPLEMIIK